VECSLLQERCRDERPKSFPLVGVAGVFGPLNRKASVQFRRQDVLEPLAAGDHQYAALRYQEPQYSGDPDVERLLDQHLVRAVQHSFHLLRAPGNSFGQGRHAAQDPHLRSTAMHAPHARSRAFTGHHEFVHDRRRNLIRAACNRQQTDGQQTCGDQYRSRRSHSHCRSSAIGDP